MRYRKKGFSIVIEPHQRHWSIGNKARLYKDSSSGSTLIVERNISPQFRKLSMSVGIDVLCFTIFGWQGRNWKAYATNFKA